MQIEAFIKESIDVHNAILKDRTLTDKIGKAVDLITKCYKNNGKVLLCGNGGSAADAQHIAAELTGRFKMDRKPLNAEALHCNTSFLTAVSNDSSFDHAFARMVQAAGEKDDILMAFSTSGNSNNIIKALHKARSIEISIIGFTGKSGGKMSNMCDILLNIPSENTPRIQEAHILIGHIICEIVEKNLFANE